LSIAALLVEIKPKQKISPAADPQMGESHPAITYASALMSPCGGLPYTTQMRSFELSHPFYHSCIGGGAIPSQSKSRQMQLQITQMGIFTSLYYHEI
jgi:hypothetical protein